MIPADAGILGENRSPPPPTIRSPATRLDTRKIIHVPFIEEFYYTVIYLYENSCTSKVIRRRGKNSLRGRNEVTPGDGYRDRVESNRIESNRHWRSSRGVVVVQRNFFSSPPPLPRFHYPVDRETSNSNIAIALLQGSGD